MMLYNKDWEIKIEVNPIADLLYKAADLIEEHGHTKYTRRSLSGAMCFLGALEEAGGTWQDEIKGARAVGKYLGLPVDHSSTSLSSIVSWNNDRFRSGRDVINAMRGAADALCRQPS